jgi:hypothetical protein
MNPEEIVQEAQKYFGDGSIHWANDECALPYWINEPALCDYPTTCQVAVSKNSGLTEQNFKGAVVVEDAENSKEPCDKMPKFHEKLHAFPATGPVCSGECGGVSRGCCLVYTEARANYLYLQHNCAGADKPARDIGAGLPIEDDLASNAHIRAEGGATIKNNNHPRSDADKFAFRLEKAEMAIAHGDVNSTQVQAPAPSAASVTTPALLVSIAVGIAAVFANTQ